MAERILILGGTLEAARLAERLCEEGHEVITSLAGRTTRPRRLAGRVRTGGFGGAEGLAEYMKSSGIDRLIDATHPFAERISENARLAAELAGLPLERKIRPPWRKVEGDIWIETDSLEASRDALPSGACAFLAAGRENIGIFSRRDDIRFVVRMIEPPSDSLPLLNHSLILGRPGDCESERKLFASHRITHLVCRNSGGQGGYGKIEAAREMGIPVIISR